MKKKILNGLLIVTLMGGAMTSFVSCKDVEPDLRAEIEAGYDAEVDEVVAELEKAKAGLQSQIDALQKELNDLKSQPDGCDPGCEEKLNKEIAKLQGQIDALTPLIDAVKALEAAHYDELTGKYNGLDERLKALEEAFEAFKSCNCDGVKGLTKEEVEALIGEKLAAYLTENEVKALLTNYATKEDLTNALADYLTKEQIETLLAGYVTTEGLTTTLADFLANEVTTKIEDILASKNYVTQEELDTQLDSLHTLIVCEVKTIVNGEIIKVKNVLHNVLASMITSIEINAVTNPIFGSASLPADVRTTVLGAYYGYASDAVVFPDRQLAYDLKTQKGLPVVAEVIAGELGELLFEDAYGNAGTVYLTINPNTVDFNDQPVALVTSQNNPSPIKLAPVVNSDKELSFGYMRGGKDNGFYEAAAYLSREDIDKVKLNLNLNELKDAAKEALSQRSKTSIVKLATTLLTDASNVFNVPAYAVKATWTEDLDLENGETTEHSVLSQYAIAATAIKPLSFDFMKGTSYDIPGIERIENLIGGAIDQVVNKIKSAIPDFSEIGEISIGKIELSEATKESLIITISETITVDPKVGHIHIDGKQVDVYGWVYDEDGNATWGKIGEATTPDIDFDPEVTGGSYEFNYELDLNERFLNIINDINESLDLNQLQDILDQLSGLTNLGSNLDNMGNELKDKIFNFIDRLNSKFRSLTGSINSALQPCLLFSDANGNVHRVTTAVTGTQVTGTSIVLAPTSYTAELFAPAYKKFIAVTDVTGNTSKTLAEINASNEAFCKVLPGSSTKTVELTGLEAGCTYEITYSALDYAGVTCTKKYYISVK